MSRRGAVLLSLGLVACSRNAAENAKHPTSAPQMAKPSGQPEPNPALIAAPLFPQSPAEEPMSTHASSPADAVKPTELETQVHITNATEQGGHDVDLAIKERIRRAAMADSSL